MIMIRSTLTNNNYCVQTNINTTTTVVAVVVVVIEVDRLEYVFTSTT